jgi:ATP-dependent DNA helicase UvrD/PcrA
VDEQQYRLMQLLAPSGSNLCVIGDPNQAIYGFRGADAACFSRFAADYRNAAVVNLRRNYRSSGTIVTASAQVIASSEDALSLVRDMRERIAIHAAATERAEAEFVVATIERLIGGSSFFAIDSGRVTGPAEAALGFADIAVLYRTDAQTEVLAEALARAGIPFKTASQRRLAEDRAVAALLAEVAPDEEPLAIALEVAAARLRHCKDADPAAIAAALARLTALAVMRRQSQALRRCACAGDRRGFPRPARRPRIASHLACREGARIFGGVRRRARGRHPAAHLGRA